MPVILVSRPDADRERRASLAASLTAAVSASLRVAPDKVQVFFQRGTPHVEVHFIAATDLHGPLMAKLEADLVLRNLVEFRLVPYEPAFTAKGGMLREDMS